MRREGRALGLAGLVAAAVAVAGCKRAVSLPDAGACTPATCPDSGAVEAGTLNVVAVGDVACAPNDAAFNDGAGTTDRCHHRATAELAKGLNPAAVLLLGDIQYESGDAEDFLLSFHPAWGDLAPRMRPSPGNHEYRTADAAGYFDYFGAAAGPRGRGYYGVELGGWYLISLNSNCTEAGGCGPGSPQYLWLEAELAAHPRPCTLAIWHHPRFSSGLHGNDATTAPLWDLLVAAGAELVLTGHDHHYERFAPMRSDGAADANGLRELVVGTGGKSLYPLVSVQPNSEARAYAYGVLALTLRPTGYDWRFVPELEGVTADQGSAECH